MTFELIEAEKGCYPKALMCRALGLSRSGHHAFSTRGPSRRALDDQRLDVLVAAIFAELGGRYGAPRIQQEMRRRGERTSRKRVAASMWLSGRTGASVSVLKEIVNDSRPDAILARDRTHFPDDAMQQLVAAIEAVLMLGERARPRLPQDERHPRHLGHRGHGAVEGLRQHGGGLRVASRATPPPARTSSTASSW
jgi:HTH-like domain